MELQLFIRCLIALRWRFYGIGISADLCAIILKTFYVHLEEAGIYHRTRVKLR